MSTRVIYIVGIIFALINIAYFCFCIFFVPVPGRETVLDILIRRRDRLYSVVKFLFERPEIVAEGLKSFGYSNVEIMEELGFTEKEFKEKVIDGLKHPELFEQKIIKSYTAPETGDYQILHEDYCVCYPYTTVVKYRLNGEVKYMDADDRGDLYFEDFSGKWIDKKQRIVKLNKGDLIATLKV